MNMANPILFNLAIPQSPHIVPNAKVNSGIITTRPSPASGTNSLKIQVKAPSLKCKNSRKATGLTLVNKLASVMISPPALKMTKLLMKSRPTPPKPSNSSKAYLISNSIATPVLATISVGVGITSSDISKLG